MPSIVSHRLREVRDAALTVPTRAAWGRCALIYVAFLACALPIGVVSGLIHVAIAPLPWPAMLVVAGTLLVHPALTEEIVFRALLLPRRPSAVGRPQLAIAIVGALGLYVAAHPVNAHVFWPAALGVLANPWYLALAALLGLACTAAYLVSGSIWPPVAVHWVTVVLWILVLGGEKLLGSRP